MLELTLAANPTTNDTEWAPNMTKKYMVASSRIVRMIPGRPPGSHSPDANDNPVPKLTKMTTEKAMASKNGACVDRYIMGDADDQIPKNRDNVKYAISKRWDLGDPHKR